MTTSIVFEELNLHSDNRGFVFAPINAEPLQYQRNAHVVISQPGAVRGNHYHLKGTEVITVLGPAVVRIEEGNQVQDIVIQAVKAYRFRLPPKVPHAIKNTGDQPNILIAFNTVAHDPQNPDVIRKVLMTDE